MSNDIRRALADLISDTYADEYGLPLEGTFEDCADAILDEFLVLPRTESFVTSLNKLGPEIEKKLSDLASEVLR